MDSSISKVEFDESFLRLFGYLEDRFAAVEQRFSKLESRTNSLEGLIDSYAKDVEKYHDETRARDFQSERIEGWLKKIAKQLGVQLEY